MKKYWLTFVILLTMESATADSFLMMGNYIQRQGKDYRDKTFIKNECTSCNFNYANLTRVRIVQGVCFACSFKEIQAEQGEFANWNIVNSDFTKARLKKSNLAGLRGFKAVFRQAQLEGANLWGADLRECDFREANLENADLSHALLQNAKLTGAVFNDQTRLPFSRIEALQKGMKWVP